MFLILQKVCVYSTPLESQTMRPIVTGPMVLADVTASISVLSLKKAYQKVLLDVLSHVEIVQRLDRAIDMLTRSNQYAITVKSKNPTVFEIVGPNGTYDVCPSKQSCTCPDQAVICKHRLAVRLVLLAGVM